MPDPTQFDCRFVDAARIEAIRQMQAQARDEIAEVLSAFPPAALKQHLYADTRPAPYGQLASELWSTFETVGERYGASALGLYKKALIASLIGDIDGRIGALDLIPAILGFYPETLAYVVDGLLAAADADYLANTDDMLREVRIAALFSVPVGGRVLDLRGSLPKTMYRNQDIAANLRCLWFIYGRLGGLAPIYRTHVELRDKKNITARGIIDVYLMLAEMMQRHPEVKGHVGTGWANDPQLDTISPHLTFQRRLRRMNGGFLRRDGIAEEHTRRALVNSRTRRRRHEEGKYQPVAYTLVWPRHGLLRWAENDRRDGGAATRALADKVFGPGGRGHPFLDEPR